MTVAQWEDEDFGSALSVLWQRHRQSNLDRISVLEMTTANVLRARVDEAGIAEGVQAAHKLAGSLGTFGFDAGSRAALKAESLLREPDIDGRLLAEAVSALRSSVEVVTSNAESADPMVMSHGSNVRSAYRIISSDQDLISRITVEAAAIGMAFTSTSQVPMIDHLNTGRPAAIIIDDGGRSWTDQEAFDCVADLSHESQVIVLADRDTVDARIGFARSGAAGVFPRSQAPRHIVSFLTEILELRQTNHSTVLAFNLQASLAEKLHEALPEPAFLVDTHEELTSLWEALDEKGADLVVVGFNGSQSSGPDLCRLVRGHPRWHRLPIVVVGDRKHSHLEEAVLAGADDYLSQRLTPLEYRLRLGRHLQRGRLIHSLSDSDPLTGAENRMATERSVDRLMRLAARQGNDVAFALVTVDEADHIRETQGNAALNAVLRRLGARLMASFRGEDTVGRWNQDGFALGIYGASAEIARQRISEVLREFGTEQHATTSGKLAGYTFSAGVASFPVDGSTLQSLERVSEIALGRANTARNCVVSSHDRAAVYPPSVVDVVLIEDDDSVADVVQHAVNLRRYDFVRFSDGAEAAKQLAGGTVKGRVVLLDVGLPSLDGFGVLQILRSNGLLENTRVIMLTARSSEAEILRALGLGATEHITKPFSIPVLLGRLDQTLARAVA